ncbi:hypothetical protein [Stackebrandtia nassauensis]|uniref:Uncharacterized protein n=1 Tax=Stackebrandtia nassauensis (strain DSM 44728 / CIP 108903 / NRRL B-16338 / NBRC 102104 / LLR-40K-21) TaxID=446470 RepID=D3Q359_STANL|nr:hypothetical protein [Stackebrandtia nassauensis]ADD40029.1 hypothetical protein Snas_0311 [Stackebrandtia nassauensis DSM 44728]
MGHNGDNAVWISVKSVGVSSWEQVDAETGVVAQSGTGNVERTVTGLYSSYTLTVYCGPSYYCSADVE